MRRVDASATEFSSAISRLRVAPFLKRPPNATAIQFNRGESPMGTMKWQPAWWNEGHATAWDRVREAMRRDWEQTKQDLKMKGGHELNQNVGDTVKQAAGKEAIPNINNANPPKIIGDWNDIELPTEYGFAARAHYKDHTGWNNDLELTLKSEWSAASDKTGRAWDDVRDHVRRGYESKH
jgi:hypothetical protein